MADLHDLTALEQGALVADGEVSSLELTEHYLDRADPPRRRRRVRHPHPERAREQARSADAPHDWAGPRPPLYGVPTAIKDLNLTAGVPTSFGSPAFADFVPDVSDAVTLALEAAGDAEPGQDEHAGARLALLHRARGRARPP